MTNTSKTILFFGTDDFSAASLRELIAAGYTIGAVVTKPDSPKGRGHHLTASIVKDIAEAHGIPVWQPNRLEDILSDVRKLKHPAGVLVSYGKLIPGALLQLFEPGIINVHPSLLPKYRGPSPVESAILHGDDETGVTIMQLTTDMDAGDIYAQVTAKLKGTETAPGLEHQLAVLGAHELLRTLPSILDGSLKPIPQDDTKATYCPLLQKGDGLLHPGTLDAEEVERRIRAFLAFPRTKMTVLDHQVIVTKGHVSDESTSALDLKCRDGRYFCVDELIGPSGRTMSGEAFLNGYA